MIRCVKCSQVYGIAKSGIIRGLQRYYCKECRCYFTLPSLNSAGLNNNKNVKHQATIHDIAHELNISKSTVSRALSGHSDINANTRHAVLETAKRLNYSQNQLAYNLVKGKTHTIGISVPEFITTFFPTFIIACQKAATEAGYQVIICHANENYENEIANLKMLFAHRVDGLLISLTRQTKKLDHLKPFTDGGIPVVMFNRVAEEGQFMKVVADDYDGAYKGVEHLITNGYRRIAHLGGPENLIISDKRYRGYYDALAAHGLGFAKELLVRHDLTTDSARKAANKLLSLKVPPDAIFAVNDPAAIQVLLAAREAGIAVPNDLGVVGFSNDIRSDVILPSLTTLDQPIAEMGKVAFNLLLKKMNGEQLHDTLVSLKTALLVRSSSVRL